MVVDIRDRFGKYAEASLLGAGRGLIALPIEHPLDTVKTRCQASLGIKSAFAITKEIYKTHGIRGFYAGAVPNGIRLAVKQMYRYPMMCAFPPFFRGVIPLETQRRNPDTVPVLTALTIASFETLFICPLERCKVVLMTSKIQGHPLKEFFHSIQGQLRSQLLRGIGAVYTRQIATWSSFLVSDARVKTWEKQRTQTDTLSFSSLMRVSLVVGLINTAANMPFDVVKTALQQKDPVADEGLWRILTKTYRVYGLQGLYAGWRPRMVQYMLQSAFTVTLLEQLERNWTQKR